MEGDQLQLRVTTFQSAEPLVRLNPSAGEIAAIAYVTQMECVHGERRLTLPCVIDLSLAKGVVAVSQAAANYLHVAEYSWEMPVQVSRRRLQFGPLIGVLANPQWDKKTQKLRKTNQLEALERLVLAGQEYGAVCFLFNLGGVDLDNQIVRGFTLHDGKWHRREFPLPDVIYDQLVSRKLERDPKVQDKRQALSKRYDKRFFNDGFFDKWQVYEWLKEDTEVRSHVPHTVRHTGIEPAAVFIGRHQVTFLKPLHGSLGLGIARFIRQKDGSVIYEVKQKMASITRSKSSSVKEALQSFRTRLKQRPYIWQEGLPLATYQHRPVDFRILMQRDHTGKWKRTKMFARVAKSGDFTSNLTGGGDAMTVDNALLECLPNVQQRTRAKAQIRRLSRQIVDAIEKQSGKTYGEVGIDLGLDTMGKVWVIEVNSKPRKTPTTEKGRKDLVDLSFERPIRYAIYLASSMKG